MTTRVARACFGAWIVALGAVYYVFPESHLYSWALAGYSSAAMVVLGVHLNKPARRLPWYLVSAALVTFCLGDTCYYILATGGRTPDFPGLADAFYLPFYPLFACALLLLTRARSVGSSSRDALIDALVPTVALGLLAWVYLIAPFTRLRDLTPPQEFVSVAYPLGDVLVLAMTLRMVSVPGRRPRALGAVGVAMLGLLVSDVFYALSQLNGAWTLGGPVDLGWLVFYAAMGLAALMPSMGRLSEPANAGSAESGSHRILWMASAALIAPALLFVEWRLGYHDDPRPGLDNTPFIAGAAAVMFVLVLARVNGLTQAQRRARAKEKALREASATLFAATTVAETATAGEQAMRTLMPPGQPHHFSIVVREGEMPGPPGIWLKPAAELPPGIDAHGFDTAMYGMLLVPNDAAAYTVGVLAAPGHVLYGLAKEIEVMFAQISVVRERIRLSSELSRREGEAYFRTLIQNAADVILIIGDQDEIRYASPSAATVLGHPDLAGTPLSVLVASSHHGAMTGILTAARSGRDVTEAPDLAVLSADGSLRQVEVNLRDLRNDPTVRGLVLTVRDVTERRRLEGDLSHLAFYDGLTGLANRVKFREHLERAFGQAEHNGTTLSVLFLDLDDFKEVNETLGHAVGDELLITVGRRISGILAGHASGTVARMGGDDFAVMIEHSPAAEAEAVADRIVAELADPVELTDSLGGTHIVSGAASIGVATSDDTDSITELLRYADLALYQAKNSDKGTWRRYRPELHQAMVQRLETRAALREATANEQFAVMYQPIVDLHTGLVSGVESLVRWQHPTRGLLGPYHFIEVAEESGVIVDIGTWVLHQALAQFAEWRRADPEISLRYISVNVSARQFREPGFVDLVSRAIEDSGCRPEWLLLEITESLVLRDADQVWADLRTLRATGVRIAIDDFGTGYSSLSYLREMPVDVLKLDKSFIDDVLTSEQQHIMVDTIVQLARNLQLAVVAEGIEDRGQQQALAAMGCPYGQGYLFSKPAWPGDVVDLARTIPERVAADTELQGAR